MRDRQYLASLALSAGVLVLVLVGLAAVPLWLGWAGVTVVAATAGGFLAWFYWGPRSDVSPGDRVNPGKRPDHD